MTVGEPGKICGEAVKRVYGQNMTKLGATIGAYVGLDTKIPFVG